LNLDSWIYTLSNPCTVGQEEKARHIENYEDSADSETNSEDKKKEDDEPAKMVETFNG